MNATSVLTVLFNKGVHVSTQDDELVIDAPRGLLQPADLAMIREHRDDIVDLLRQVRLQSDAPAAVIRVQHGGRAPVSTIQQNVLLMESVANAAAYGNIPLAFHIRGSLDRAALAAALDSVIAEHEILRTTYEVTDEMHQVIHEVAPLQTRFLDLHDDPAALEGALLEHERHSFDLETDWPVRAQLVRIGDRHHVLSLVFHQIAMDGHSCQLFMRYLSERYAQRVAGTEPIDREQSYQYAAFADWQRRFKNTQSYAESVRFWKDCLRGAPELHSLPTDFVRPPTQSFQGHTLETALSRESYQRIETFARDYEISVFAVLQATFALLISRYSGDDDVVVGTAVANRTRREFFGTLGNLVNTVVFRFRLGAANNFSELLMHVKQVVDLAMQHQQVPFNVVVDQVRPSRSVSHNPLVQLMLVMQEEEQTQLSLAGAETSPRFRDPNIAKFDLALHVYKQGGGAALRWEYNTSLFRRDTIARIAAHFQELLLRCMESPVRSLFEVPLSVVLAQDASSTGWRELPAPVCVDELIARQVRMTPHNVAIRAGGDVLTFAELEAKASRLAAHLNSRRSRTTREFRVGVAMDKSPLLVIALYAALKAGAVYVPLDPSYPKARLDLMMEDAGLHLLLLDGATVETRSVPQEDVRRLLEVEAPAAGVTLRDPAQSAYVLYTSGSTGKPKGVLVPHRSLFYSLWANRNVTAFSETDTIPCLGSQAFGISLLEILLPLISGGCVTLLKRDEVRDLDILIARTQEVTVMHAVPSLMAKWLERVVETDPHSYKNLRLLLVGGESVPDDLLRRLRRWRPGIELIEFYGMTESAVVCASYRPTDEYAAHHCIGRPHPTARFYILNRSLQLQPIGVPGELHIAGPCLASQYLNQPELTRERFIDHPLMAGDRLYKTGDRARLLPDGQIEFLGRVDHQVSLRGVRIECGEIESLLSQHPAIKKAVAHVVTTAGGESTLVAYYTTHEIVRDVSALNEALREHLASDLPDYMRPTAFHHLDDMPLNPNGKIDRKALPVPQRVTRPSVAETSTQSDLCDLWGGFLEIDGIGIDTNFFELGGNSLLATKVVNQAKKHFDIDLPVTALFESSTVRALSEEIDHRVNAKRASALLYQSSGGDLQGDEILI